jgi:hypothetical protein
VYTSYYLGTDKRFNPQVTNCKSGFAMADDKNFDRETGRLP